MAAREEKLADIPWWKQGWVWFLGGPALFLLLSPHLGWSNAAGAFTAAFTGLVALYTRRLAELQGEVNRVMERQTKVLERQAEIQEAQQELQEKLAAGEARPLLALQATPFCDNTTRSSNTPYHIALTNLGRYGVMVVKLKQYQQKPNDPDSENAVGTPAGASKDTFPIPLPPGESKCLKGTAFDPNEGKWIEVVYEDGASGRRCSDVWRYTGRNLGFVREWWAKDIPGEAQGQG